LKMNSNHRTPSVFDHAPKSCAAPIAELESGVIMTYAAEKSWRFWPQDLRGTYEWKQWVMWQIANQGRKPSQGGHFCRQCSAEGGHRCRTPTRSPLRHTTSQSRC